MSRLDKYTEFAIASMIYVGGSIYRMYKALCVQKEKRILVSRLDAIGDMTCSSAFLRNLRQSFPDYQITLACSKSTKNLVEYCPYVDEIFTIDTKVVKHRFMTFVKRALRFSKEHFANRNYEIAIAPYYDNTGVYPDQYICLLSGADKRYAYTEMVSDTKHEYFMGLHDTFFNKVCMSKTVHHEVESTLNLLNFILGGYISLMTVWSCGQAKKIKCILQKCLPNEAYKVIKLI